ncbi:MAG: hypothetical protein K9H26_04300 [Prolixibacteraceae bacterium]|nr:hypothetical protein [Prolixibacteraceae bacterium]
MTTIIIHPKTKDEKKLLERMLKKMNISAQVVEDSSPNYETLKAMEDVEQRKGKRVKNADELFKDLGI